MHYLTFPAHLSGYWYAAGQPANRPHRPADFHRAWWNHFRVGHDILAAPRSFSSGWREWARGEYNELFGGRWQRGGGVWEGKIWATFIVNYQFPTKFWNCMLKPWLVGKRGASFSNTHVNTSKSVLHPLYGNEPVASSTKVMPSDQMSARTSYIGFCGSIRSGCGINTKK